MRRSALLAMVLLIGGCGPFRRAKAPPPPPGPMPVRIPDQVTSLEPAPPPKNLPPPPPISAPSGEGKPAPSAAALGLPSTPTMGPPRPAKRKRAAKRVAPPPPPAVAENEVPASAPVYRLGELRSTEEKESLRRQAEQHIAVCNAALVAAESRPLSPAQSDLVSRVRTFSQQAREVIDKDPGEARNLAAKGKTFAEALLAELK
ncbi:MAG: hypothetical protein JNM66_24815 [Bryobacterales bacterium]|nr:hypothetical protein [Bryobacterales bacterium]